MPFKRETARVPTTIGTLRIVVEQAPTVDGVSAPVTALLDATLLDATGAALTAHTLDLWPHLTPPQQTAITNLLAAIRTKATTEMV